MDINGTAPLVSRHSIIVQAPVETVWAAHTQINEWPGWQPDITRAALAGPIAVGATFSWQTAGLDIVSVIDDVQPPRRIAWHGEANGILGIHVWTFSPNEGGTLVTTEESWEGGAAIRHQRVAASARHVTGALAVISQGACGELTSAIDWRRSRSGTIGNRRSADARSRCDSRCRCHEKYGFCFTAAARESRCRCSSHVREVTGVEPRDFRQFAKDYARPFVAARAILTGARTDANRTNPRTS